MHGRNDLVERRTSIGPAKSRLWAAKRDGAVGDVLPCSDGARASSASGATQSERSKTSEHAQTVRAVRPSRPDALTTRHIGSCALTAGSSKAHGQPVSQEWRSSHHGRPSHAEYQAGSSPDIPGLRELLICAAWPMALVALGYALRVDRPTNKRKGEPTTTAERLKRIHRHPTKYELAGSKP